MSLMTDHIEGSARVHTSIWQQATDMRFEKIERKAYKKARKAKAPRAYITSVLLSDRLGLEGRGWECESAVSVGIATNTRYLMSKDLPK